MDFRRDQQRLMKLAGLLKEGEEVFNPFEEEDKFIYTQLDLTNDQRRSFDLKIVGRNLSKYKPEDWKFIGLLTYPSSDRANDRETIGDYIESFQGSNSRLYEGPGYVLIQSWWNSFTTYNFALVLLPSYPGFSKLERDKYEAEKVALDIANNEVYEDLDLGIAHLDGLSREQLISKLEKIISSSSSKINEEEDLFNPFEEDPINAFIDDKIQMYSKHWIKYGAPDSIHHNITMDVLADVCDQLDIEHWQVDEKNQWYVKLEKLVDDYLLKLGYELPDHRGLTNEDEEEDLFNPFQEASISDYDELIKNSIAMARSVQEDPDLGYEDEFIEDLAFENLQVLSSLDEDEAEQLFNNFSEEEIKLRIDQLFNTPMQETVRRHNNHGKLIDPETNQADSEHFNATMATEDVFNPFEETTIENYNEILIDALKDTAHWFQYEEPELWVGTYDFLADAAYLYIKHSEAEEGGVPEAEEFVDTFSQGDARDYMIKLAKGLDLKLKFIDESLQEEDVFNPFEETNLETDKFIVPEDPGEWDPTRDDMWDIVITDPDEDRWIVIGAPNRSGKFIIYKADTEKDHPQLRAATWDEVEALNNNEQLIKNLSDSFENYLTFRVDPDEAGLYEEDIFNPFEEMDIRDYDGLLKKHIADAKERLEKAGINYDSDGLFTATRQNMIWNKTDQEDKLEDEYSKTDIAVRIRELINDTLKESEDTFNPFAEEFDELEVKNALVKRAKELLVKSGKEEDIKCDFIMLRGRKEVYLENARIEEAVNLFIKIIKSKYSTIDKWVDSANDAIYEDWKQGELERSGIPDDDWADFEPTWQIDDEDLIKEVDDIPNHVLTSLTSWGIVFSGITWKVGNYAFRSTD